MSPEEDYFEWLLRHISSSRNRNPDRTYRILGSILFAKEFTWGIPMDENRAFDGLALRDAYCDYRGSWEGSRFLFEPCSFLEMMIGLAYRAAFEGDGLGIEDSIHGWFWRMASNCGLAKYKDGEFDDQSEQQILEIVYRINHRLYMPDGTDGFFPLKHPDQDQRKTELWYQMSAYILENSDIAD